MSKVSLKMNELPLGLAAVLLLAVTAIVAYGYGRRRAKAHLTKQQRVLTDVTHELRTPLTVIESYASMIKRWAGADPKLREEATNVILSEASRLRRLTARLISRPLEDAPEPLEADAAAPYDVTAQLRTAATRLATAFNRSIHVHGTANPIYISGSEEQLEQLWIILLDNAIKYSQDNIVITVNETEHTAIFNIRDRGIGIPPDELPKLFDRHYRAAGVAEHTPGSGIGLSLAEEIVRQQGGTIRIESEPGQGTTVIVTLPKR